MGLLFGLCVQPDGFGIWDFGLGIFAIGNFGIGRSGTEFLTTLSMMFGY
jgi:hypothetical protein